jgi:hypothetical protein
LPGAIRDGPPLFAKRRRDAADEQSEDQRRKGLRSTERARERDT